MKAGRQLRVRPTASTIVKASTTSTKEARNEAVTVDAIAVRLVIGLRCPPRFPRPAQCTSRAAGKRSPAESAPAQPVRSKMVLKPPFHTGR